MDWVSEIEAARGRVSGHVRETPVMRMAGLWQGGSVEVKLEQMQHTGSFKARGAMNSVLAGEVPEAGLVAASGGNHGAAVAWAARAAGHRAKVFVPEMAGSAKIALIERMGADLVVVPGAYANALEQARAWEAETGAMQVHAYDAPLTVAGQGTCFAEWERQGLEADTVLIAVGGGGLIAGAMAWFGARRKFVAVEPVSCAALSAALAAGAPVDVEVSGVAANALGARRIGGICFEMAQACGLGSVLVEDAAIVEAQAVLWREARQLVEPAGAAVLAALISGAYVPEPGERVAVLVCGGNVAPDPLG